MSRVVLSNLRGDCRARMCGGFTLLELLIANVIAVILLGSVLISLRIINQHQQQTRAAAASANLSRDPIVQMVRRDLANSRRMWQYPDGSGVVLSGYAGLSQGAFAPTGEMCRVYYRIVKGELVRMQEPLAETDSRERWSELVCAGAAAFSLVPQPDRDGETAAAEGGGQSIPARVTFVLQFQDSARSFSEDLWVH